MDIDTLISLSDYGFWKSWTAGAFEPWTIGAVVISLVVAIVMFGDEGSDNPIFGTVMLFAFGIGASLLFAPMNGETKLDEEFQKEHIEPFIADLEYQKMEIDDVSFLEEELYGKSEFSKEELKNEILSSVLVTYKEDGKIRTLRENVIIRTDTEKVEDIHMEFKEIEKEIPRFVDKGKINIIVHIPEDFFKQQLLKREQQSDN